VGLGSDRGLVDGIGVANMIISVLERRRGSDAKIARPPAHPSAEQFLAAPVLSGLGGLSLLGAGIGIDVGDLREDQRMARRHLSAVVAVEFSRRSPSEQSRNLSSDPRRPPPPTAALGS
jgi:hypothetical protein